jgi:hypothetical protein
MGGIVDLHRVVAEDAVQDLTECPAAPPRDSKGTALSSVQSRQFDTVLGTIGFDEKGDITGFEPWGW